MDTTPLLSAAQVAARLGLSAKSVRRLALAGTLRSVRVSDRIIRFDPADIETFIAERTTAAAS